MGAPIGNQFWKLRATSGVAKTFATPDDLWNSCVEYFEATDNRKWVTEDWVGKDATKVERKTATPYTLSGLSVFLDVDRKTLLNYGTDEKYKDFFHIMSRVREIMFTQKFEGAAVGAFNSNLIARELGIADKQDLTLKRIGKDLDNEENFV